MTRSTTHGEIMKCYTCGKSDSHTWGLKCPRKPGTTSNLTPADRITFEYISELVQAAGRYTSDDFEWWLKNQILEAQPRPEWPVFHAKQPQADTTSPLDAVVYSALGFMPSDDVPPLGNLGGGADIDDLIDYY
jgi:hypothetical protein